MRQVVIQVAIASSPVRGKRCALPAPRRYDPVAARTKIIAYSGIIRVVCKEAFPRIGSWEGG